MTAITMFLPGPFVRSLPAATALVERRRARPQRATFACSIEVVDTAASGAALSMSHPFRYPPFRLQRADGGAAAGVRSHRTGNR